MAEWTDRQTDRQKRSPAVGIEETMLLKKGFTFKALHTITKDEAQGQETHWRRVSTALPFLEDAVSSALRAHYLPEHVDFVRGAVICVIIRYQ